MMFAKQHTPKPLEPMAIVNSLLLKAIEAPNSQALEFVITNETRNLIPYDRAILCQVSENKISLLGISGQSSLYSLTEFYKKLTALVNCLEDPSTIHTLNVDSFRDKKEIWTQYQRERASSIIWLPIYFKDQLVLGLWIERWDVAEEIHLPEETMDILSKHLLPGYGGMWGKFRLKYKAKPFTTHKYKILIPILAGLLLTSFLVHLPLRVVAFCEVVPKDPTVITAPLKGVIEKISVEPGAHVDIGTSLFIYDKRLFEQELKIAQNDYFVSEAALNRALSLGVGDDQSSLNEVSIYQLKLQKQKIDLEQAKDNYDKVNVKSPTVGTVIIDNPDEWVGKPVQIGEKIMIIADLTKTEIKIWIPENENININPDLPIEVVLNVNPGIVRKARLNYIGNEVMLSSEQLPSFLAKAQWKDPRTDVKSGLKGTAVLYGEKVSLFYFLVRKPWILIRKIFD